MAWLAGPVPPPEVVAVSDPDDDFLDGCELDFTEDPDDDETASLRPLFPDGIPDEGKAALWRALAEGQTDA